MLQAHLACSMIFFARRYRKQPIFYRPLGSALKMDRFRYVSAVNRKRNSFGELNFVQFVRNPNTTYVRKVSDLRSYLHVAAILRHPDHGILRSSPHLIEPHGPNGASTF